MEHRAFPSKKRGFRGVFYPLYRSTELTTKSRGARGVFPMKINYHPKLKELARKLRNKSTKSEIKRYNEKYGWGFTSDSMLY